MRAALSVLPGESSRGRVDRDVEVGAILDRVRPADRTRRVRRSCAPAATSSRRRGRPRLATDRAACSPSRPRSRRPCARRAHRRHRRRRRGGLERGQRGLVTELAERGRGERADLRVRIRERGDQRLHRALDRRAGRARRPRTAAPCRSSSTTASCVSSATRSSACASRAAAGRGRTSRRIAATIRPESVPSAHDRGSIRRAAHGRVNVFWLSVSCTLRRACMVESSWQFPTRSSDWVSRLQGSCWSEHHRGQVLRERVSCRRSPRRRSRRPARRASCSTKSTASPASTRTSSRRTRPPPASRTPTLDEMSRKLAYRVDEARHVLEVGQPAIEIAGLRARRRARGRHARARRSRT